MHPAQLSSRTLEKRNRARAHRRDARAKLDAYECGIEPSPHASGRGKVPVKYFLTAMLFIVFDIEIIFLLPWATVFRELGAFGFGAVVVFAPRR